MECTFKHMALEGTQDWRGGGLMLSHHNFNQFMIYYVLLVGTCSMYANFFFQDNHGEFLQNPILV